MKTIELRSSIEQTHHMFVVSCIFILTPDVYFFKGINVLLQSTSAFVLDGRLGRVRPEMLDPFLVTAILPSADRNDDDARLYFLSSLVQGTVLLTLVITIVAVL